MSPSFAEFLYHVSVCPIEHTRVPTHGMGLTEYLLAYQVLGELLIGTDFLGVRFVFLHDLVREAS